MIFKNLRIDHIPIDKHCHCGANFNRIPKDHKLQLGFDPHEIVGVVWSCSNPQCHNTLAVNMDTIATAIKTLSKYA